MKKNALPILLWFVITGAVTQPAAAQFFLQKPVYDSAYVATYLDKFAIRIMAPQNHASLKISLKAEVEEL